MAAVAAALLMCAAAASGQQTDMRLRIAWGGGAARQWQGTVQISEGAFSQLVGLGLEADSPGSFAVQGSALYISQRAARSYDGFDVLVEAPLHARLVVDLIPDGQPEAARRIELPLAELVTSRSEPLDDRGNRVLVRRAPGDELRLQFRRDSLVFAPGEPFSFSVIPHLTGLSESRAVRCSLALHALGAAESALWSDAREVTLDARGSAPPIGPIPLTMPAAEGVYELNVTITQRRLATPFSTRVHLQRKLQLVVVDAASPTATPQAAAWQQVEEIDPAKPGWWERLPGLSKWKMFPEVNHGELDEGAELLEKGGRTMVRLKPGGWQAYPLPVQEVGKPHVVAVEYPTDLAQSLGISIIEPNAAGQVAPIGLDSGVYVPAPLPPGEPALGSHRVVFWPRTKNPFVLLTNRTDGPAIFARIRLLAGPAELPSAPLHPSPQTERLLAAFLDKPLFPENFCAPEGLDEETGRSLDDWNTFYLGGRRLVAYLKYAGYNGAVMSVLCEGSTIYPSQLLEPTPKYDMGVHFATGQDARRKDVLEMLFRLFDREGLRLVPAIQFAAPLPELEQRLRPGGSDTTGIRLISDEGATWPQRHGTRRGLAPYYNPLDPRVQAAMRRVVEEVVGRYSHHPSFSGVALQLSPHGYAQLPDEHWGYDQRTMEHFRQDLDVKFPEGGPGAAVARRIEYLQTTGRQLWLQWRATELASFYGQIQQDLLQRRRDARLYLAGAELLASRTMQETLRPALLERVPIGEALLQVGVAPELIADYPHVVLLRPQRLAPLMSLQAQAVDVELRTAPEVDRYFNRHAMTACFYYHEPLPLRLPAFDAVSPFGKENTETWLVSQLSPAAPYSRRRFVHSLAMADAEALVDGGWMVPLGQEESLRSIMELYRRLPLERFRTVEPVAQAGSIQPVTIRTLDRGAKTFVYMVNDSPWPVTVSAAVKAPPQVRLQSLTSRALPSLIAEQGRHRWHLELPPYDVAGAVFDAPHVTIENCTVQVDEAARRQLLGQIQEVRARITALKSVDPLPVLENPGFELASANEPLPGWIHARGPGVQVQADSSNPHTGARSLHIRSTGSVAWVRSQPFAAPRTGRLSVGVWLRTADPANQPPLRLAIEALLDGEPYYRPAVVGAGENAIPISDSWLQQYVLKVDDLPLTGLTEMRVAFDLMGKGEVWIDDVEVKNLYFERNEQQELLKNVAVAQVQLEEGKLADCLRSLEGYWPRFLLEHVPLDDRLAELPRRPESAIPTPARTPAPSEPDTPSTWQRVKDFVPKWPF